MGETAKCAVQKSILPEIERRIGMVDTANCAVHNPRLFDLLFLQSDEIDAIEEFIFCLNEKLNGDTSRTESCEAVNPAGGIMGFSDKNLKRLQNCRLRLGTLVEQI